jgi:MurNAc alpha-1-phosphate uridylyltransferase
MKAMILAAGFGRRMLPLTADCPKPLLRVGGKPLLEYHILHLKKEGFTELVVNAAHLSEQIVAFCGDGSQWGVHIDVSLESAPLETAGGIIEALPLLGNSPFAVVNGDIWCPFPFSVLRAVEVRAGGAHLVLVDNPQHHQKGDFTLGENSLLSPLGVTKSFTYSGIGVYDPGFFKGVASGPHPLKPLLDKAIEQGLIAGQYWPGAWEDVGTPERLARLNQQLDSP